MAGVPAPAIRPYRPEDRDAVYDVCVRTAAAGGDARGLHLDDDLMPDTWAGPYLELEPGLAFVLDDGARAVGYVLGTADTPGFVRAYRERWLPRVAGRRPVPADPPVTADDRALHHLLHPERMLVPGLEPYPAHLHIDLLPEAQGAGWGRVLITELCDSLRAQGVPGVHAAVSVENPGALAFYPRVGFTRIGSDSRTMVFGRRLSE